nr:zinc finger protein 608 [Ciona intestinalis]|eukprot:XP_018670716.1 zinc finger protein 608 [Ciona intestinalis]
MSSEAILTSQRTAGSPTTKSIFSPSSDKDSEERTDAKIDASNRDDVSSGDDDWNDDFGKLVIDLETENDGEKASKESSRQQIKNNNNNNSSGGSPCTGKVSNNEKLSSNQAKGALKNSIVQSTASGVGKSVKSKPKKKSSSKHHGSAASSRTSSPTAPNSELTGQVQSKSSHTCAASDSRSSGLGSTAPRASNSPDEASGKKKSSKSGRSHHKKHKHSSEKNEAKADGEKSKSKSKHSSCTNSPTSSGSHYLSNHVTNTSASLSVSNKPQSYHRSASPSISAISTPSSCASKFPHMPQSRTPVRTPLAPAATAGVKLSTNDKDSSESCHSQHSRKKHRKGLSGSGLTSLGSCLQSSTVVTSHPRVDASAVDPPQFRSFGNSGKRDRNAQSHSNTAGEGTGPKKMKLEMDTKSLSKEENRSKTSANIPSPCHEANTKLPSPKTATSPGNATLIPATFETKPGMKASDRFAASSATVSPPVFAPSSIFATSIAKFGDTHTSPVWSSGSGNSHAEESRKKPQTSQRSVGTLTLTADVGVMTEPDALGPCEPGTSVHLDGIVWHETDTGVLVVNVTWRNRTYMGTLLDATKHDWAPPRFSDSDLDIELRGKNGRPKRQRGTTGDSTSSRKGRSRGNQALADDVKGSPSTAAKRRGKNSESESLNDDVSTSRSASKRARVVPSRGASNSSVQQDRGTNGSNGSESSTCSSPVFIDCPHPKCNKRYKHINGLKYHQAHAHLDFENVKEESEMKEDAETKDSEAGSTVSSREDTESKTSDSEAASKEPTTKPSSSIVDVAMETPLTDSVAPSGDQTKVTFMTIDAAVNEIERANIEAGAVSCQEPFKFPSEVIPQIVPVPADPLPTTHVIPPNTTTTSVPSELNQSNVSSLSTTSLSTSYADSMQNNVSKPSAQLYPVVPPSIPQPQEPGAGDSEIALAVKALLQTQDSQDDLPGLTAPYSQDSPPPTLSLVSRSAPTAMQNHMETTQSFSSAYPRQPSSVYPGTAMYPRSPASDEVPISSQSLRSHLLATMTTQNGHPFESVTTPVSNVPTSSMPRSVPQSVPQDTITNTTSPSSVQLPGTKEHFLPTAPPHPSTHTGNKMAKGKTVPIPVDPNHGLMISPTNPHGGSPGNQPNSAKKVKKSKKKPDGRPTGASDCESTRSTEGPYSVKQESHSNQDGQNAPSGFPANGAAAVLNNLATSYQNDQQKIQQTTPRSEQVTGSSQMVIKSEPGVRFPPSQHFNQHLGMSMQNGRKLPGIVMPSSSVSGGQFTNNITVTGTFHPHPDPHKPQTAVSAQAQDRQRTARVSPSPSSSNRNNNNKLPGKEQAEAKARVPAVHQEHSQPTNLSDISAPDSTMNHRPKYSSAKSPANITSQPKDRQAEISTMGKFQDKMISTIESAYAGSRPTPRSKASTPQLEVPRPEPNTVRSRPCTPKEQRPMYEDSRPKPPVASPVVPRPRLPLDSVQPIPRAPGSPKLPVDLQQLNQRGPYLQSIYNYPLQNYGFVDGYQALLDPVAVRQQQQYMEYLSEMQKQQLHHLQQQQHIQQVQQQAHFQQQQQQAQQAQMQAEKKNRKPLEPHPPKIAPKVEVAPIKPTPQNPATSLSEKGGPWVGGPHMKRHSTGSISPLQNHIPKEKPHGPPQPHHPSPTVLHPRYKSPQPSSHPQISHTTPTHNRSHSVTVNPLAGVSGSPSLPQPHPRSEIQERTRRLEPPPRDEGKIPIRKPATPTSRSGDGSPEKMKDGHPASLYRSHVESPGHLQYYAAAQYQQVFDPSRPSYRLPYSVHGLPPGTQIGTPIFPAQAQWGPQHPAMGKHSPGPVKQAARDIPPNAPRSPREDHPQRGRPETKGRENFVHNSSKERRVREVPPIPRKLSRSPDPKSARHQAPTPLEKPSRSHTPNSNPDRAPSPPTQRHLHTHHHIHEGVTPYHPIIPQHYGYPAPIAAQPVIAANTEAMAAGYPGQFPSKRD